MGGGKKILVTGGAGYIGSHTVVELLSKGYEVLIIDSLSNSRIEVLDGIKKITRIKPAFFQIDLCDEKLLNDFFEEHKIDAVIHFAALKAVGDSVEYPLEYYRNNIVGLLNLLDNCVAHHINYFVFSSSCSVYGDPDYLPIDEKASRKQAESPYGNTKQIGEDIISDTTRATSLHAVSLRYFNPVGAHASAIIGEFPLGNPSNLMPMITQTAIGKRQTLQVFGNDYDTSDGSCIRDYIHVVDLALAHVIAIERLLEKKMKKPYEVFNLGTGTGFSVLQMISAFEKATGVKLNYEIATRRQGDVIKVYADTAFANKELGWRAERGIEEMVASAWKWEQELSKKEKAENVINT